MTVPLKRTVWAVHRLVQTQFRYFLSLEQRQKAFNDTVTLVSYLVPKSEEEKGQLYDAWTVYNRYLQHVLRLRDLFEEERKLSPAFRAPQIFCEILNDYQRYLYEKCAFEECERTCAVNRDAVATLTSEEVKVDLEGAIISHQAQVIEKLGDFPESIRISLQGIDLRLGESPRKHILLAYSACNVGIVYSSANDYHEAMKWFQKAREWWKAHFSSKGEKRLYGASVLVSEARCKMGLGDLDDAEAMLETTIAQVKEEKPLNFGTLAYAYFCYGSLDRVRHRFESAETRFIEAQNAWMRGENTRIHPFNAGILYKIGIACLDQGKIEAAIKHIKESIEVTQYYRREMPIEHGRNLFKLSEALLQVGDDVSAGAEATSCRDEAAICLKKKNKGLTDSGLESSYDDLIPVYWR